jgi:type I restriction enzyme S subunit
MRSNYKPIGNYIRLIDERNRDLKVATLLGLSINKVFIPSVTNIIGSDMANYKIIRKGQFSCSLMQVRRDKKIPVALLRDFDEAIISQAYPVFEIVDLDVLDPEYLMMWMSRSEFDRHACFLAVGGVRGSLEWEDLCEMELPVPPIGKQREIVREYNTIVHRIQLNEQLNQKLEDTAQAIYKHWFVDFEFPISAEYAASIGKPELEGKPYKSRAGEMVFCEELEQEIPKEWPLGGLHDLASLIDGDRGKNYPSKTEYQAEGYCLFLSTTNVTKDGFLFDVNNFISKDRDERLNKGKVDVGDIVLTTRGSVGNSAYYSDFVEYKHVRINSGMIIVRANEKQFATYVFTMLKSSKMAQSIETFISGSAQQHLPIKDIKRIPIILPENYCLQEASKLLNPIVAESDLIKKEIRQLKNLKHLLLVRIAAQTSKLREAA